MLEVGVKVKVISIGNGLGHYKGLTGVIKDILSDRLDYPYAVVFDGFPSICFAKHELEVVEP